MADENLTTDLRVRRQIIKATVDVISSLPDEILQHIFSFMPIKFVIRTILLSKRWRHVWCDTPSLTFDTYTKADSINKTLSCYTAPKMMNFHLSTESDYDIDRWIKFAMSRNVENLFMNIRRLNYEFTFPDFFYINSSIKQLTIRFNINTIIIPTFSVSWTSLKKLSLRNCRVSDKSMSKILSGCPVLESLALVFCSELLVLDLSKSLRLRTLEVNLSSKSLHPGPKQILAPHIHRLRLFNNSQIPWTLVDVSSLTEANMDICFDLMQKYNEVDFLQKMVLKMLKKLQNAEKLTFGGKFLQILSLAEVRGVPFPELKVKALVLETGIFKYVIPGIERLLQNSPCLKKLIVHEMDCKISLPAKKLINYLTMLGVNPAQCWKSKDGVF